MDSYVLVIASFVTVFSFGLFLVSLASYRKYKNAKLLFVSAVFFVFLCKGILLSMSLFLKEIAVVSSLLYISFVDLIVLLLLFIATVKR